MHLILSLEVTVALNQLVWGKKCPIHQDNCTCSISLSSAPRVIDILLVLYIQYNLEFTKMKFRFLQWRKMNQNVKQHL